MDQAYLECITMNLLSNVPLNCTCPDILSLKGGGNNRVFRVKVNGDSYLLKSYFCHPLDPRDRLETEFRFIDFACENGIQCVPKPIALDRKHQMALYQFVEGKQLTDSEITAVHVQQAINFFKELNKYRNTDSAKRLPDASEACFSIQDHVSIVSKRIKKLKGIENQEAQNFVMQAIVPMWRRIKDRTFDQLSEIALSSNRIDTEHLRISPSDFGFHNAILARNDQLYFIDFEYAGWDDPAKTVCDFFCHPAVPVDFGFFDLFVRAVSGVYPYFSYICKLLLPIHQIKWSCIMLNDFLPIDGKRRKFADTTVDNKKHKVNQLQKSKENLQKIHFV